MAELSDDDLLAAAAGPAEMQVDGQRVKARSVDELIKLQAYLDERNRTRTRNPLRTFQMSPPGTQ